MSNQINLEPICAKYGKKIVECYDKNDVKNTDKENVITKALGVLAENGFYAMNVFLLSCQKANYGSAVFDVLMEMFKDTSLQLTASTKKGQAALDDIRIITENLPRLILARRVTDQALTFARYHCKAIGTGEN